MQLGPIARAHGVRLLALDDVDSTNEEARRLIESGERGPLWIVARRQTRGRGRLGREWVSSQGNLHASFVFGDLQEAGNAPELGFVTGVAAIRALRACAGDHGFALKWPNDLLLDGAKLGGILLECVTSAALPVAIVGVGVNIAQAPEGLPYAARALCDLGCEAPSTERFFMHFSDAMAEGIGAWGGHEGFAAIREEWLRAAAGLGRDIRVILPNEALEGRMETIDASGRLVLMTMAGRRVVEAGDVLIGPRSAEERCA